MTSAAPPATLIIGEHSSIAAALTAVLNQLGATLIDHVPNGAAALLLMREKSYQLLILLSQKAAWCGRGSEA